MDCSSFVSWLYWAAYGKGPNHLSPNNWRSGYTDDMAPCGLPVFEDKLQPGDVCFYGVKERMELREGKKEYGHATLYVGNGQVVSMGNSGLSLLSLEYFKSHTWNTMDCRTYPAFFAKSPGKLASGIVILCLFAWNHVGHSASCS
jgi:cell wall-associated NlpC family hydrolase